MFDHSPVAASNSHIHERLSLISRLKAEPWFSDNAGQR